MTEVREISSGNKRVLPVADGGGGAAFQLHEQYGLFATTSYSEGDVILTESPLAVSSSGARSQFDASSLAGASASASASAAEKTKSGDAKSYSIISDRVLPSTIIKQIASSTLSGQSATSRTSKVRGMILALASYAAKPPTGDTKKSFLELYHPPLDDELLKDRIGEKDAVELARLALKCCQKMAAPESALSRLLRDRELATKICLIYSCNAFEGGRIYRRLSRANHSCNPNAVVVEGDGSSDGASDVSVLKAACDIAIGDEICISYLGKYLFAGYPIRRRMLLADKHFVCRCARCEVVDDVCKKAGESDINIHTNVGDLASRVPCPVCHPRTGRYLDDDVMFDEDDNFKVSYAIPANGLTAEERPLRSPVCKSITAVVPEGGSMRKKKEALAIKYMCMAEEKVFDRLESRGGERRSGDGKKQTASGSDDGVETEREMDQQFLQMATSICGAQHWTTHFLNLSLIEESLASSHSTLMTMGHDAEKMEELFVEIAEAADGIQKAYSFASSLQLKLDPSHWLFDYTLGLARTLVGLGDMKSQKYAAEWIKKVEKYSEKFESEGMNKVVIALRDAWKRRDTVNAKGSDETDGKTERESKRMKTNG